MELPGEGNVGHVYHMFAYLSSYHNLEMVLGPRNTVIWEEKFERKDWNLSEFRYASTEDLPENISEPFGLGFTIIDKMDSKHVAGMSTCLSREIFMVYLNSALIYLNSNNNNSIQSSSFRLEFISINK